MKNSHTLGQRLRSSAKVLAVLSLLLGVLFFPLPVRDLDRAYVIQRDAVRLRDVEPVFVDWWWRPFYDSELIANGNPKWHLHSELNIDLRSLEESGFSRMNKMKLENLAWGEWYENGNVLLEIADQSSWDEKSERGLRLHVYHGTMGGQGYTVHIYRCLIGRFARYSIEWES